MARLFTAGAEVDGGIGGASIDFGPITGTVTRDTATFRSGAASWKFDSAVGNALAWTALSSTLAASTTYYLRAYCRFVSLPSVASNVSILGLGTDRATTGVALAIDSSGSLRWIDPNTGSAILGATGTVRSAPTLNQWYRIEASVTLNGSSQITGFSYLLDGVQGTAYTGKTIAITATGQSMGWIQQVPGASIVFNIDDVALNDSNGNVQNTWPGEGSIILLKPISLNANGGSWTDSAAATTSAALFGAVDNTPPTGIADTTANAGHQDRNAAANTSLDMNMTDYTTAGVTATDRIRVVVPIINTGAPVVTGAKAGSVGVVSNPTIANIAFVNGASAAANFWQGNAAGTYPTGWKWEKGTTTYDPTVTPGTSPVMRVTITGGTTSRVAMVDFMGIYVEYSPKRSLIYDGRRRNLQKMIGR